MKRLPFLLLLFIISCTQKQPAVQDDDSSILNTQIATREKQITDSTNKDTALLIKLYAQQATDYRKTGNWPQFCSNYMKRYALSADSSLAFKISSLDSIIRNEPALLGTDTLRNQLADAYFNRADEWNNAEQYNRVVDDLEKYFQLATHADTAFLNYASTLAGNAWLRIGDRQQAIFYHEKEMQYATALHDGEEMAIAAINLSNSYRENGEALKAIETARTGLQLNNVQPKRKAYLNASLAEIYNQVNRSQEALVSVQAALPLLNQLPYNDPQKDKRYSVVYKVLGDVMEGASKTGEALAAYRTALEYARRYDWTFNNRDAGKLFMAIGQLHHAEGRDDSALYYYDKAANAVLPGDTYGILRLPAEVYHENTLMEALDAASVVYLKKYKATGKDSLLSRAYRCISLAFRTETMLRQLYIYDNSKYTQGSESRKRSERGIEVATLLAEKQHDKKWLEEAFVFAEKSRANALLDKIKENLLSSLQTDSSFTAARQLWFKIKSIEDQLSLAMNDPKQNTPVATLLKEKEQLEAAFAQNKSRVNGMLQNAFSRENEAKTSVAAMRHELLKNNDAIIEYFAGDSLLYRFVMQKEKEYVVVDAVPLAVTDSLVRALLPYLTEKDTYNNDPAAYNKLASGLYEKIFPSLPIATKKIVIIADGLLQLFPFEALTTNDVTHVFLLQKFRFTAAFSCASLLQQMNIPAKEYAADAVAFAPFTKNKYRNLPILPQSGKETEALRTAGNVSFIYTDTNATAQRFMQQAANGRILHIASHAFADGSDTVQPRIEFADGSLSLEKIYALQLNNRLVVLSACQTGIGKLVTAEGALSLARGFYYAGAKNVINSLWEVDDESAGFIFEHFYRQLKKTASIDASLALARREYFNQASPEKRSPYYWASFVCVGDGDFTEPKKDTSRLKLISAAGLLGLAILIFTFRRRNNK